MNALAEEDDTSAIDLAVTFFCSVLMLFVFIAFDRADRPDADPRATIGQDQRVLDAIPPSWSPIAERPSWAILSGSRLTLLRLSPILDAIESSRDGDLSLNGAIDWAQGAEAVAPNHFSLKVAVVPSDVPPEWRAAELDVVADAACPETGRPLWRVLVASEDQDLSPFLAYARRCALRYQVERANEAREDGGAAQVLIALEPRSFSRERMFR